MKILSKKKSVGYFIEKSIYLLNHEIYYRIKKDVYSKKYYLGFSSNKVEIEYLKPYMEAFADYDTIIVIDSNIGEAFLTLRLLPDILRKIQTTKPMLVITQKYHEQVIGLFEYSIPYVFIPELHFSVMKSKFKINDKRFYICYSHPYYRKIEKSLTTKKPIHFYDAMIKHFDLNKKNLKPGLPTLSNTNKNLLYEKLKEIKLDINNFVIISPEANSCKQLSPDFWAKLAEKCYQKKIDIFLNCMQELYIPNTKSCYLSFEEFCFLLQKAKASFFLRSGLCDIATSFISSPCTIIYSELNYINNVDTLAGFSVKPFSKNLQLISEYNIKQFEEDVLIDKIIRNIL